MNGLQKASTGNCIYTLRKLRERAAEEEDQNAVFALASAIRAMDELTTAGKLELAGKRVSMPVKPDKVKSSFQRRRSAPI